MVDPQIAALLHCGDTGPLLPAWQSNPRGRHGNRSDHDNLILFARRKMRHPLVDENAEIGLRHIREKSGVGEDLHAEPRAPSTGACQSHMERMCPNRRTITPSIGLVRDTSAENDSDRPPGKSLVRFLRWYRERSEEHTSELQSHLNLVCRLLLEKKK